MSDHLRHRPLPPVPKEVERARMLMLDLANTLGLPVVNLSTHTLTVDDEWEVLANLIRSAVSDLTKGKWVR